MSGEEDKVDLKKRGTKHLSERRCKNRTDGEPDNFLEKNDQEAEENETKNGEEDRILAERGVNGKETDYFR